MTVAELLAYLEQQLPTEYSELFKIYKLHVDLLEKLPIRSLHVHLDHDIAKARSAQVPSAVLVHSFLQAVEEALLRAPAPLPPFNYLDGRLFWRLIELNVTKAPVPTFESVDVSSRLAAANIAPSFFAGFDQCSTVSAPEPLPTIKVQSDFFDACFSNFEPDDEEGIFLGQALAADQVAVVECQKSNDEKTITLTDNEVYRWHRCHLEDPDAHLKVPPPATLRESRLKRRRDARYMAFFHRYASSLHAVNELLVKSAAIAPEAETKAKAKQSYAGKKAAPTGPSRQDEIKYWNTKRREYTEIQSELARLDSNLQVFSTNPEETISMVDKFISEAKFPISRTQGKLFLIKLILRQWAGAFHKNSKNISATSRTVVTRSAALEPRSGLVYAIRAVRLAFEILVDYFKLPATTQRDEIIAFCQGCLTALGFTDGLPALNRLIPTASSTAASSSTTTEADPADKGGKGGKGAARGGKGKGGRGGKPAAKTAQPVKPKDAVTPEDIKLKIPKMDVGKVPTGVPFLRFQLEFCGPHMDRGVKTVADDRVAFTPEAWQVDLINVVQNSWNSGALVVAPTSSGKTFVSYYAMKKVLLDNHEDVVVYVAPTQALVEQVAADVVGKFGTKQYPDKSHRRLWGILTPKYRQNALNSQVLVTVPQVLESLLLSPDHHRPKWYDMQEQSGKEFRLTSAEQAQAKSWISRIKYIILDEIHCMGNLEGGQTWERIVALAPAPIIGLSATVGNPGVLYEWMKKSQEARGFEFKLIGHKFRFSHLYYYQYEHQKACKNAELDDLQSVHPDITAKQSTVVAVGQPQTESLQRIHPIGCLSANDIERGNLDTLDIAPDSALTLYDVLVAQNVEDSDKAKLASLDPQVFWAEKTGLVNYMDVREWSAQLKAIIQGWSDSAPEQPRAKEQLATLLETLQGGGSKTVSAHTASSEAVSSPAADPLFKLLLEMNEHDLLPMLGFSFDRYVCEQAFDKVLSILQHLEEKKRSAVNNASKAGKTNARLMQKTRSSRLPSSNNSDPDEDEFEEEPIGEQKGPLPEFSFVKPGYFADSFNSLVQDIKDVADVTPAMIEGLHRGIGLHHDSLPTKYLRCVESLFRMRHVRVVFCTKTLTMGINMPCRAVVFLADSVFLNPMYFQQMSGRSGRRGYDLVGHVIFFNILWPKIQRLMVSGLPTLSGGSILNVSFVTRLLCYYNSLGNDPATLSNIRNALQHRSLADKNESTAADFSPYFFRFTLEYLLREGLMDENGQLLGFSGLLLHLQDIEPANLQLVALFQRGYFHKLCRNYKTAAPGKVLDTLLDVLAHLFGGAFWVGRNLPGIPSSDLAFGQSSSVSDEPVSHLALLENHRTSTLRLINKTLRKFAAANPAAQAQSAPMFGKFDPSLPRSDECASSIESTEMLNFSELTSSIRPDFQAYLSSFPDLSDADSRERKFFAKDYLQHFWKDGSMLALIDRDRIPRNQVWYMLSQFDFTLKIIVEVLICRKQTIERKTNAATASESGKKSGKGKKSTAASSVPVPVIHALQDDEPEEEDVADNWDDDLSDEEAAVPGPSSATVAEVETTRPSQDTTIVRPSAFTNIDKAVLTAFRDLSVGFAEKFKASMIVK